jgi:hypothetical protein
MRSGRPAVLLASIGVLLALSPTLAHRRAPVRDIGARAAHPHRARGAVHVHTGLSPDGRGSLDQIARAARSAGLRFVVVADHNDDASLGYQAYRGGVLILGGVEKSTDAGHALVLGTGRLPFRLDGDPESVVRDAADLGGFVIVSHPTSSHPEGRWSAAFTGVAGVEVLNLAEPQAWPPADLTVLGPLAHYAFDAQGALLRHFRRSREALALWDRLLAERPVAGVLGTDAHGGFPLGPVWIPFPSHREIFRFASQHLLLDGPLTGEAAGDRRLILDALRRGRGYLAIDALADASGFLFEARSSGRRALMGDSLPSGDDPAVLTAVADAPPGTRLVLLKDGREILRGEALRHPTREPGVYRVEAYLDPRFVPGSAPLPWILSNPIHVFPEARLRARAEKAARLPADDAPPASLDPLDRFEGARLASEWQIDSAGGAGGRTALDGGALRFDYALGPEPRSHASLCRWRRDDLRGRTALAFRVRSDRPLRFDVQVRVLDEAAPDGARIWRRSVRADLEWRSVTVPFARLTSYDRRGGRPDLGRVQGFYLHIDEAMLPPGSTGRLWIDDLCLGR